MGIDAIGQQETADHDYVRRRRGAGRIFASSPAGSSRAPITIDDFDLSHLAWMDDGACRGTDPEAFFPLKGEGVDSMALQVCQTCPVRVTCLDYALERPQLVGVWGGFSDEDRKRMRKKAGRQRGPAERYAAP